MIELAVMIEGQDGVNWPIWQRVVRMVEDLGFAGLYRSDHFTGGRPPSKDSLELWVSLVWLADHTQRIEFGSLVSPLSFRDPVFTARQAVQVDNLSDGRLRLGLGAGWNEHEHDMFGYDLLDLPERFERFQEGLEVITRLIRSDKPVDYDSDWYDLDKAILLPRPTRAGGPPIVIGGNGTHYTFPLVVKYADEWNATFQPPEGFTKLNQQLTDRLQKAGRDPAAVRRTMMTNLAFGRTQADVERRLHGRTPEEAAKRGVIYGTPEQVVEQLQRLDEVGVQRVMLQWLDLEHLEDLEAFAQTVLPKFQ